MMSVALTALTNDELDNVTVEDTCMAVKHWSDKKYNVVIKVHN